MSRLSCRPTDNIGNITWRAAQKFPRSTLTFDMPSALAPSAGSIWTYAQVEAAVAACSARVSELLGDQGATPPAEPPHRVAILRRNHPDICLLAAAVVRSGATPALISADMVPADLAVVLQRTHPRLVIVDEHGIDLLERAGEKEWRTTEIGPVDLGVATGPAPVMPPNGAAVVITHTSGTTGVPKLVEHDPRAMLVMARFEAVVALFSPLGVRARTRSALHLPWVHSRSLVALFSTVLRSGCSPLLLSDPDVGTNLEDLASYEPEVIEALPARYAEWQLHPLARQAFARTRVFMSNFDAIHPRLVRRLLRSSGRRACFWGNAWGQTESGAVTATVYARIGSHITGARSSRDGQVVGRPLPMLARVRVVDPQTGEPVGRGVRGRLEVRSRTMSRTYVGQEELHRKRRRGAWWAMGDVGHRTMSGQVVLADRECEAIDGDQSCLAIEDAVFDAFPDIHEVVICRLPNGRAVPVIVDERGEIDVDQWRRSLPVSADLADPVVLTWDEIPRTATGKVRRHLLAAVVASSPTVEHKELL